MEPFAAILADVEPHNVLELGHDRAGRAWSTPPESTDARLVHLGDRQRWAAQPTELASELASLDSPFDLVIDHATDDVATTVGVFEVIIGRVAPTGLYVIDATLPRAVVLDLMFAAVVSPEVIERVALTQAGTVVRRGLADWSFDRLRMSDITSDPFGIVA